MTDMRFLWGRGMYGRQEQRNRGTEVEVEAVVEDSLRCEW